MTTMATNSSQIVRARYAARVAFGFKAPISMVLLPLFAEVLGPFKFVHVVRDGRDLAFSDNQSPVLRFYNATFGTAAWARHARAPEARALELWAECQPSLRASSA